MALDRLDLNQKNMQVLQPITLTDATVFLHGAELFGHARVALPAGESEVVFSHVSKRVVDQTLLVTADQNVQGVTVLSASVYYDYLNKDTLSPLAQQLDDELKAAKLKRDMLEIQMTVLDEQLAVMKVNRSIAGKEQKISVSELAQMMDFVAQRTDDALSKKVRLNLEIENVDEQIQRLKQQLEVEAVQGQEPQARIAVKFFASAPVSTTVYISYMASDAGWVPSYDLHVVKVGEPIDMTYKARVFQNTGVDWERVRLTLSSGRPSQGAQVPRLDPWYVNVCPPPMLMRVAQPHHDAIAPSVMMEEAAMSEALVVEKKVMRQRAQKSTTLGQQVSVDAQGVNVKFEIEIPYTVPSDGKGQVIMIKDVQVPAHYQYMVVPKLDADAFLQANITEWTNLNLLPGESSVYFENSFVGKGHITLEQINEGMNVLLGRDQRVRVERTQDKNNTGATGLFGGSMQRIFAYTFNVINMRPDAVELVIVDQLPVSQNDDITLADLSLKGAEHDELTGKLKWTLNLAQGEQRQISYTYALKYPKDVRITSV